MINQRQSALQLKQRKNRDGDWICIKCSNYNYSFRQYCNRCRCQQRRQNERLMNAIGKQNYGENSFPSVLFLTVQNKQPKQFFKESNPNQKINYVQKIIYSNQQDYFSNELSDDVDLILTQNVWISNLIND